MMRDDGWRWYSGAVLITVEHYSETVNRCSCRAANLSSELSIISKLDRLSK